MHSRGCSLRDSYPALLDKGYTLIGISKDSVESHRKFAEKHSLPFLLLSDPSTEVNQAFGVWQLKKMAGGNIWAQCALPSSPMPIMLLPK